MCNRNTDEFTNVSEFSEEDNSFKLEDIWNNNEKHSVRTLL